MKNKLKGRELEFVEKVEKNVEGAEFIELTGGYESKRAFSFRSHKIKSDFDFLMKCAPILREVYGKDTIENEIFVDD